MKYRPRGEFVLFQIIDKGSVGSIHVPQVSAQGKERVVLAVGPDVPEGTLSVGDKVLVIGVVGQDVVPLPNEQQIYMTKHQNVALICEEDEEE